jgi:spoIIIJ-associated protein
VTESTTSAVDTETQSKSDTETDNETASASETQGDTGTRTDADVQTDTETRADAEEQTGIRTDADESDGSLPPADLGVEPADPEAQSSDSDDPEAGESGGGDGMDRLENEGEIAADYLEELLDIADLDGDLDMDVEGDRAAVSIVGGDVRQLVGRNGEVLEALQELTRLAVYRETGERSRLMLDVGGFRADRRSRLEKVAAEAVDEVKSSGEKKALEAMTPFERKVVHDVVAAAGLSSASEGEEPRRYVVVLPA